MGLTKLKETAENHAVFVLIGVFMLGAGAAAVPMKWMEVANDSELAIREADINRLTARLGAVTRTVGKTETTQLQTSDLLISSAEAADLPSSLEYLEAGDLYHPPLDDLTVWKQTTTDEGGLIMQAMLLTRKEVEAALGEVATQPVYLWRSSESHDIVASDGSRLAAFPYVAVERTDVGDLSEQLEAQVGSTDLEALIGEDPLGALFELNMFLYLSSASPDFTPILSGIQRTDEALYAEVQLVLRNVKVDGVMQSSYYLKREFIFLADGDDLVVITTNTPSLDRRASDAAAAITAILSDLRVVL